MVIPALDEASQLPPLLEDLRGLEVPYTVVVVDGGSRDGTAQVARDGGARALHTGPGRARQMNAGARFLTTPWLLFLHADSRISARALRALEGHILGGSHSAAHFRFAVCGKGLFFRVLEIGQRTRERLLKIVYGDQGLLIPRTLFTGSGSFPDEPLMEDVILTRKLLAAGRLVALPAPLNTSPRRYEEVGHLRNFARNTINLLRFALGATPTELAPSYPPRRTPAGGARAAAQGHIDTLLVFAKAPRAGSVKTRLAADVGERKAAHLYRYMARKVVSEVLMGPAETIVCYDPADGEREVRRLFGDGPRAFVYQGSGGLGQRMSRMIGLALSESDRVVVIGTDAPTVDRRTIRRAFRALDTADLVIGPAVDGGYYLLGLKHEEPSLFTDIEWSSPRVLATTVSRGESLGLGVTYLEVESDVDTIEDLTPELEAVLGGAADVEGKEDRGSRKG